MGADGGLRDGLRAVVAVGLGGTMNCGVEGVEGREGVVELGRDGKVLLAASKDIG